MRAALFISLTLAIMLGACQEQERAAPPRRVHRSVQRPEVVFFHGMYPPEEEPEVRAYRQEFFERAAARGFKVRSPGGRQGWCAWREEYIDYFCWPTSSFQAAEAQEVLEPLRAMNPAPVLVGHSNGGFFVMRVVQERLLPVSGLVVLHAGGVGELKPRKRPPPTLMVAASDDETQCPKMEALDQELTSLGWAHRFVLRPGGHAFTPEDMDTVLDFLEEEFP